MTTKARKPRRSKLEFFRRAAGKLFFWPKTKRSRRSNDAALKTASAISLEDLESRETIGKLFSWARLATKLIASGLLTFFVVLQLKGVQFGAWIEYTSSQLYIKIALIIYYICWVYGANFDYSTQESGYLLDPNQGRVSKGYFIYVPVFVVIAALLLWASQNERYLAVALGLFYVVDVIGWHHNQSLSGPIITASKELYKKDEKYFQLERLKLIESFLFGRWARWRYITMAAIIILIDVISFSETVRNALAVGIQYVIDARIAAIKEILPGFAVLIYVLIAEGWMWAIRVKTRTSIHVIDSLKRNYRAIPRSGIA